MKWALAIAVFLAGCSDPANTQYLPIGSRCGTSSQCGTSPFDCNVSLAGGYCEKPCTTDGDCPADSLCSPSTHECRRKCQTNGDCRAAEGYACVALSPQTAVCEAGAPMDGGLPSG